MPFVIRPYRLFPVRCFVKSIGLRRGVRITLLWGVVAGIAAVAGQADFARAAGPCSLRDATDAIRQSPKDANAYVIRAVCYLTFGPNDQKPPLKNLEAAVKDLEEAIKLDPKNFFARHNYAHAAYLLGYPKFAVSEFTKAISLNPKAARSYLGRGWAYLEACEFKDAGPDFQRAINLDASLRGEVATRQRIADLQADCTRPPVAAPNRPAPGGDPYLDHNSDYWRNRRWEERPH
jgi:tetratricopeptide (TPR) repeat protein